MDFIQTTPDEWLSHGEPIGGQYQIRFATDVAGIRVRPHYHALVQFTPAQGRTGWWFAGRRGRYFSLNAAKLACQRHLRIWQRAVRILHSRRKGRQERLDALNVKAVTGKGVTANRILSTVPTWVAETVDANVLKRLVRKPRRKTEQSA